MMMIMEMKMYGLRSVHEEKWLVVSTVVKRNVCRAREHRK